MSIHGDFDHELKIGDDTQQFRLVRGEGDAVMYNIRNIIPEYRDPLRFTQSNWIGGHGSYERKAPDVYFEGQSIDTTQDGCFFLGPLINPVSESGNGGNFDSAVVQFIWFEATSEWLCATAEKIYRYDWEDSEINTNEELDDSETGIDCDGNAATAIPVTSRIKIEKEIMTVSATGTTLTVTRGVDSDAVSHLTDKDIFVAKGTWVAASTAVAR
ncbi:unnamed protein product, partial [marine sediment metagenome]